MNNYKEAREIINSELSIDDQFIKSGYNIYVVERAITIEGLLRYLAKKHANKDKNCFNFYVSHNAKGDSRQFLTIQLEEYGGYGVLDLDLSVPPEEYGEEKWGEILKLLS